MTLIDPWSGFQGRDIVRHWVAIGRFESRPELLRTKVYSAFHPSGVGKWVPVIARKAMAGMAHSDCRWTCGCAGKMWNPWRTRAISERFCGGDSLRRGVVWSVCTFTFAFTVCLFVCLFVWCLTALSAQTGYIAP